MRHVRLLGVMLALTILLPVGIFAEGAQEDQEGMKVYDIFLGFPKENYPEDGTIFGNWLEEETGVRIDWEFLVGDLGQRMGLMAASGDYPDAVHARTETDTLHNAGAFIQLDELIEEYGPNIQELYEGQFELFREDDGHIYWLPAQMPYGDADRRPKPSHAVYVQQRVLEANDYVLPGTFEELVDMLIEYAQENPETNGYPTKAWTGLYHSWREYAVFNAPSVLSGNPNDGVMTVEWVDGKWHVRPFWEEEEAYRTYELYNKMYLEGLYDEEAFVMDFDQYLARLTTGSILAFYDQSWSFSDVQTQLLEEGEGTWYVPVPVALEGYDEGMAYPPQPQQSQGMGITVNAEDPEGLMKYFNVIADWDTIRRRLWGREGVDYEVNEDGVYYRTEEQLQRWNQADWKWEYGFTYWGNFLNQWTGSLFPDGKNNIHPGSQPVVWEQSLTDVQRQTLEAMNADTFRDSFNPPDMRRSLYYPAWTIELENGGVAQLTQQRIGEIRRQYYPRLIMADEGTYDQVWDEYIQELHGEVPEEDRQALYDAYQTAIDARVEASGGYGSLR